MGIVNATPDSFSDRQGPKDPDELAERGLRLVEDGAAIVDVGGESGRTDTEAVPVEEEIARVVPVVERLAARGALVSVDTWRAPVARAALEAGAAMINDVSGLSDEGVAERVRRDRRRARDHAHARGRRRRRPSLDYDDVVGDVRDFLERAHGGGARRAGRRRGPHRARPRHRHREDAGRVDRAAPPPARARRSSDRPLLLAVSRKDFVGALTERAARRTATPARSPPWAPRCAAARTSSACTTWPARATTCACTRRSRTARTRALELAPELRREAV